jgi:hypothetical protein
VGSYLLAVEEALDPAEDLLDPPDEHRRGFLLVGELGVLRARR